MDVEIFGALVGVFGAAVGAALTGFFTVRAAKIGQDWESARSTISKLCDSAEASYRLEQLYVAEVARLDPANRPPETIKIAMRRRVEEKDQIEHPRLTPSEINKLRSRWCD